MSIIHNEKLVEEVLKFYETIKPKNPEKNYTVLAAIITNINSSKITQLTALATGTQANLRIYPDDIEDCHAESIVKRAYKRYLINVLIKIISESKNYQDLRRFINDSNICRQELTLFISKFPCGLIKRYEGVEPINEKTGKPIKRKPGRGTIKDGSIVYVEKDPCCDKLQKWIQAGLQGKKLKDLFNIECKITKILIGNCENHSNFDYKTSVDKLKNLIKCDNNSILIESVENVRSIQEFVFDSNQQPQPVSIAWWASTDSIHSDSKQISTKRVKTMNSELIVDGHRRGLTKKLLLKGLDCNKLKISNYWLKKDLNYLEKSIEKLSREDNSFI